MTHNGLTKKGDHARVQTAKHAQDRRSPFDTVTDEQTNSSHLNFGLQITAARLNDSKESNNGKLRDEIAEQRNIQGYKQLQPNTN